MVCCLQVLQEALGIFILYELKDSLSIEVNNVFTRLVRPSDSYAFTFLLFS